MSSYNNVPPQLWMLLEKEIRAHLVGVFDLKKTGITEVRDNTVITDGFSIEDLKGITLEKMIAYIGSEETFPRAWELTCAKAKYELNPPIELPKEEIKEIKTEKQDEKNKQDKGRDL